MTSREEKDAAAKAKLDAYVARVVAEAPPLTPEQRDQITRLFRGARVNVEKEKELMEIKEVRAPWTQSQVDALNAFQAGPWHPFTCPNHGDPRDLIATTDGWVCPRDTCDYRQDWAHDFMASRVMIPNPFGGPTDG